MMKYKNECKENLSLYNKCINSNSLNSYYENINSPEILKECSNIQSEKFI